MLESHLLARLGRDRVLSDDLGAAVSEAGALDLKVGELVELGLGDGLGGGGEGGGGNKTGEAGSHDLRGGGKGIRRG